MGSCTRRREASTWPSCGRALAGIVKQERKGEDARLFDLGQQIPEAAAPGVVGRAQAPEVLQRDQGVLVHGVAMEEIADHQALDLLEFGENRGEHAGLMHGANGDRRVRQGQQLAEYRPQRLGVGEVVAQARQARIDALLGFGREAYAVTRHEFEETQGEFGLHVQPLGRAEMDAFPVDAELGVGNAGAEIAKLREEGTGLAFAGFQRADGGTVYGARVPVVFPHPLRGVGELPVLGQGILRVEGEQVVVAAALDVQVAAQAGQKVIGLAQFGTWDRRRHRATDRASRPVGSRAGRRACP